MDASDTALEAITIVDPDLRARILHKHRIRATVIHPTLTATLEDALRHPASLIPRRKLD